MFCTNFCVSLYADTDRGEWDWTPAGLTWTGHDTRCPRLDAAARPFGDACQRCPPGKPGPFCIIKTPLLSLLGRVVQGFACGTPGTRRRRSRIPRRQAGNNSLYSAQIRYRARNGTHSRGRDRRRSRQPQTGLDNAKEPTKARIPCSGVSAGTADGAGSAVPPATLRPGIRACICWQGRRRR